MILKKIYDNYISNLEPIYGEGEAIALTTIAIEYVTGFTTQDLTLKQQNIIGVEELKKFDSILDLLKNQTPVQYITGYTWFYNLKFTVNENVLIPRAETEELVFEVINYLKNNKVEKILDIGTGSGCIPISIKKNNLSVDVTAIDISENALQLAALNSNNLDTPVKFKMIDFLDETQHELLSTFDVIISNPPYIPENEKITISDNVLLHEPHLALFVPKNDPLLFYKKIALFANSHLNKNGAVFLEVHEDFAVETAALFSKEKYDVKIKLDMQGKQRMLLINRYP